jgi:hypothetical protein
MPSPAAPSPRAMRFSTSQSPRSGSAAEQELFIRLSVFAGCTLKAAEKIAGADLEALQSLVEKSLRLTPVG